MDIRSEHWWQYGFSGRQGRRVNSPSCHLPCGVIHSLMDRIYYSYIMKIFVQLTVLNSLSESKSSGDGCPPQNIRALPLVHARRGLLELWNFNLWMELFLSWQKILSSFFCNIINLYLIPLWEQTRQNHTSYEGIFWIYGSGTILDKDYNYTSAYALFAINQLSPSSINISPLTTIHNIFLQQ